MQWKRPLIKQGMSYDRAPCTQAGGGLPLADPVAGFTLIEVIASLVLIGIMAVTVATALVHGMQGFVFTKENTAVAQKAQLAMHRLQRELTGLTDLDAEVSIIVERQTEISIHRALGLSIPHIKQNLRNEVLILLFINGSIGTWIGYFIASLFSQLASLFFGTYTTAPFPLFPTLLIALICIFVLHVQFNRHFATKIEQKIFEIKVSGRR